MSRALDILNRKAPNTAGLLVLNPQEVEVIKGEIRAYDRHVERSTFAAQETEAALEAALESAKREIDHWRKKVEEGEAKISRNDTYIKYQNKHIYKLEEEVARLGGTVKDRGDAVQPLSCSMFGGKHSDQYNALRSALTTAAKEAGYSGEYCEYEWIEKSPRTSLIVNLVDALHSHGYEIKKK